jgi:hypothetical protein
MIRITITPAAFAAIAATLALGTVAVEPERDEDGSVHIWLDPGILARSRRCMAPARATATRSCGWRQMSVDFHTPHAGAYSDVSIALRSICTAISRNSIFATAIVRGLASRIKNAREKLLAGVLGKRLKYKGPDAISA